MIRRPPRSTRTDTLFPTRRSSDLGERAHEKAGRQRGQDIAQLAAQLAHRHVTRFLLDLAGENAVARRLRRVLAPGNVTGEPCLDVVDGEICQRSEERRVGKECVSTCRSRWSPYL